MNTVNTPNPNQRKQTLMIIWLVFLMSTISFPTIGYIVSQKRGYDPSLNSDFAGALMLGLGIVLFIISHFIFKKISGKPIPINKYQVPFTVTCILAESISLLGLWHVSTSNLDKFAYVLFGLGFLAVLIKKPDLNLITIETK